MHTLHLCINTKREKKFNLIEGELECSWTQYWAHFPATVVALLSIHLGPTAKSGKICPFYQLVCAWLKYDQKWQIVMTGKFCNLNLSEGTDLSRLHHFIQYLGNGHYPCFSRKCSKVLVMQLFLFCIKPRACAADFNTGQSGSYLKVHWQW